MKELFKNKNLLTLCISFFIIVILLVCSSFFHVLNKSIQNNYYNIKNNVVGLKANKHIVVVEIDDRSFTEIWKFPFSRWVYAQVLQNLKLYDPAVVAFDLLFLDPSQDTADRELSQAITETPHIVLWSAINSEGALMTPFSGILRESYETWFLSPNIDRSNRTVYSFSPLVVSPDGVSAEHFAVVVLKSFYSYLYNDQAIPAGGQYEKGYYTISPKLRFPLSGTSSREILINFIPKEEFTRISLVDLYTPTRLREIDKKIDLSDKILLIGPAAEGLKDEFYTPNGVEYGVYIHANILNTFLSWQYMMYFHKYLEWVMIFFLIVLSVSVNLSSSSRVLILSNGAIVLVFWFVIPLSILLWTNLILNYPSEIIFSLILAFSSANIVKYLIEDANKKKLNQALSEYVSSNIASEILEGNWQVNLNGERRKLGCFFSDIEGFTTLSEKLSPEQLVSFLREYLSLMTKIIMNKAGHVDKFEGDAIMALWGVFTDYDVVKDAEKLCRSALEQQKALWALNVTWSEKLGWEVCVRMGIHAWEAIVWNIWAVGHKMEFTALWDDVNIASRLEGVNKYYGTYICVSESIFMNTQDQFYFRFLDTIQVQWKEKSIKIYELIGEKGMYLTDEQEMIYKEFSDALDLYLLQNFSGAKQKFWKLAKLWDPPSKTFSARCEYYISNPPWDAWTWVWRMEDK